MPEHIPTAAPTRDEAAGLLRKVRTETRHDALAKLVVSLLAIVLAGLAQYVVTGSWAPTWWAGLLVGISLPDLARSLGVLSALATHNMTFYAEATDGTVIEGCGRRGCPNEVMRHG